MIDRAMLREGTPVYSADGDVVGTIDRHDDSGVYVGSHAYPMTSFAAEGGRVVLRGSDESRMRGVGPAADVHAPSDRGEYRVPIHEERLFVEKRDVQLGEVRVHRTVTEEKQTVPVEVMHEEVHVETREVPPRPAAADELARAFEEGVIRVPVRGEELVVTKQAVVTGEVVVTKERAVERQEVSDTVRQEHVQVENDLDRPRPAAEETFQNRGSGLVDDETRAIDTSDPNFRTGFAAARHPRFAGQDFEQAEPDLRAEHERSGHSSAWDALRNEIRDGWNRGRER